nr:unnamed protein product [Callosobruchus chinensis]
MERHIKPVSRHISSGFNRLAADRQEDWHLFQKLITIRHTLLKKINETLFKISVKC